MKATALFISDAHIGFSPDEDRVRTARLLSFLQYAKDNAAELFILGDLFDFWFEYRYAIPKTGFAILAKLMELSSSGMRLTYVGGNHDFWIGEFLKRELGAEVTSGTREISLQGRRILVAHGDGFTRTDAGYRFLKIVLRNRAAIFAYRLIHPDIGFRIAKLSSTLSRKHTEGKRPTDAELIHEICEPRFNRGIDSIVLGHIHRPIHLTWRGKEVLVLGDWMKNFSFARLKAGEFTLEKWDNGKCTALEKKEYSGKTWPL
jgi:UDP-2,3-diacylglucosamine hydrolase